MEFLSGHSPGRLLLLHGGAPSRIVEPAKTILATCALREISLACFDELGSRDACEFVTTVLRAMEADPQFNAGLGGSIQSDGQVRVSAALMDGTRQAFSGVINAVEVKHP